MPKKIVMRVLSVVAVVGTFSLIALIALSEGLVDKSSDGRVFRGASDAPKRKTGLVLGCARYLHNGRENLFFRNRIDRVCELYEAEKIRFIIVSGDNSRKDYDEPTQMRNALVERGIPDEVIFSDFAGFSTLDSVIRAKRVFGQSNLTVISQEFHVRRAVFIGSETGIDIVGVSAKDVVGRSGIRTHLREYLARVKAVLDLRLFHRSPHFLGDPIFIGKKHNK